MCAVCFSLFMYFVLSVLYMHEIHSKVYNYQMSSGFITPVYCLPYLSKICMFVLLISHSGIGVPWNKGIMISLCLPRRGIKIFWSHLWPSLTHCHFLMTAIVTQVLSVKSSVAYLCVPWSAMCVFISTVCLPYFTEPLIRLTFGLVSQCTGIL